MATNEDTEGCVQEQASPTEQPMSSSNIPFTGFYHVTKPGCKKRIMKDKCLKVCNCGLPGVFFNTTLWNGNYPTITPYPRNERDEEYPSGTEYDRVTIKAEHLGITTSARMFCIRKVKESGVTQVHLMLIRGTDEDYMTPDDRKAFEFASSIKMVTCALNDNSWLQINVNLNPVGMKVNEYTEEDKTIVNVFVVGEVAGNMLGDEKNWDTVLKMQLIPGKGFYHITKPDCKERIMEDKCLKPCGERKGAPTGVFLNTTLWNGDLPTITPYPRNESQVQYPSGTEYDRVTIKAEDLGITPRARMFYIGEVEESGVNQVYLMLIRGTAEHEMEAVQFANTQKWKEYNLSSNPWLRINFDPINMTVLGMEVNEYTRDKTLVNVLVVGNVVLRDEEWDQVRKISSSQLIPGIGFYHVTKPYHKRGITKINCLDFDPEKHKNAPAGVYFCTTLWNEKLPTITPYPRDERDEKYMYQPFNMYDRVTIKAEHIGITPSARMFCICEEVASDVKQVHLMLIRGTTDHEMKAIKFANTQKWKEYNLSSNPWLRINFDPINMTVLGMEVNEYTRDKTLVNVLVVGKVVLRDEKWDQVRKMSISSRQLIPGKGFYHVTKPGRKELGIMQDKCLKVCEHILLHSKYDGVLCKEGAPAGVFLNTTLWNGDLPTRTPYPRNERQKCYPFDTEYDRVTIKAEHLGITPRARMFYIGEVEESGVNQVHLMLIRGTTEHEMKAVEFATKQKLMKYNLNSNPWLQINLDTLEMEVNEYTEGDKTFVNVFVVGEVMLGHEDNWDKVIKMK